MPKVRVAGFGISSDGFGVGIRRVGAAPVECNDGMQNARSATVPSNGRPEQTILGIFASDLSCRCRITSWRPRRPAHWMLQIQRTAFFRPPHRTYLADMRARSPHHYDAEVLVIAGPRSRPDRTSQSAERLQD